MNEEEFLNKLSNYENWSKLNNPIFQTLVREFFKQTKDMKHQVVAINKRVADGDFNKNISGNEIARIYVIEGNSTYLLTLVEKDDDIEITITIEQEMTRVTYTYKANTRKLSSLKEVFGDDGFHEDYQETIKYYDETFKLRDLDVEEELDKNFSSFFNIPLKSAKTIRKDFKTHREELIEMLITLEMQEENEEDAFMPPMTIENLPLFIECKNSDKRDICMRFDNCEECFYYDVCTTKDRDKECTVDEDTGEDWQKFDEDDKMSLFEERAENIKLLLSQNIPSDIPLVFGVGVFINIEAYILGETKEILETTGTIIGRIDSELLVYQICLSGNTIIVYKKGVMSQEEVNKLYEQGLIDTDELKEFFRTGRNI